MPTDSPNQKDILPENESEKSSGQMSTVWFRRSRRWSFRVKRLTSWGIFAACCLVLFVMMGMPVAVDHIVSQAMTQLEKRTHLRILYSDANIRPWSLGVTFYNVNFYPEDSASDENDLLLHVDRVGVSLDIGRLISEYEFAAEVVVSNPSKIELGYEYGSSGVILPPKLNQLWVALTLLNPSRDTSDWREHSIAEFRGDANADDNTRWRLRQLDMSGLNVDIELTSGAQHQLFSFEDTQVGITRHETVYGISSRGFAHSDSAFELPFIVTASFNREWQMNSLHLTSDNACLSYPLFAPNQQLRALPLDLQANFAPEDDGGNRLIAFDAKAPVLTLHDLSKNRTINDYNVHTSAVLSLRRNTERQYERFDLKDFGVDSRNLNVGLNGSIENKEGKPWYVGLNLHKVQGDWKNMVVGFVPISLEMPGDDGSIVADLVARGASWPTVDSLTGTMVFDGVTISSSRLPFTLHDVSGKVRMAPDLFDVDNLSFVSKDNKSSASVTVNSRGDWFRKKTGVLDAQWDINIDMAELLGESNKTGTTVTGRLVSKGTLRELPLAHDNLTSASEVSYLDGIIQVHDFSAIHSKLPASVSDVNLFVQMSDNVIRTDNFSGQIGGLDFRTSCVLTRESSQSDWLNSSFLSDSTISGTVGDVTGFVPATQKKKLPQWVRDSEGTFVLDTQLNGTLLDVGLWVPTVSLNVKNFKIPVDTPGYKSTVNIANGKAIFANNTLRLSDVVVQPAANTNLIFDGSITAQKGLELTIGGEHLDLDSILRTMPAAAPWQSVSGQVTLDGKIVLPPSQLPALTGSNGPNSKQIAGLARVADWVTVDFWPALRTACEKGYLEASGTLTPEDNGIDYTHYSMPEHHVDKVGNNIPHDAAINNIRGKILWALEPKPKDKEYANLATKLFCRFSVPQGSALDVSLPGSDRGKLYGNVILRPGTFPTIELNLNVPGTASLDQWNEGWGKRVTRFREEGKIPEGRDFPYTRHGVVIVNLSANQTMMRGVNLGKFSGHLTYDYTTEPGNVRSWKLILPDAQCHPVNGGIINYGLYMNVDNDRASDGVRVPTSWKHTAMVSRANARDLCRFFLGSASEHKYTGELDAGEVVFQGVGEDRQSVSGGGIVNVRDFRMLGSRVFGRIGQLAGFDLEHLNFSTLEPAKFAIRNGIIAIGKPIGELGRYDMPPVQMSANNLQMSIAGTCSYIDWTLDVVFRLALLRAAGLVGDGRELIDNSGISNVPLVGYGLDQVAKIAGGVVGGVADELDKQFSRILAFHAVGSLEHPQVSAIALEPVLELFRPFDRNRE
ncbi:hypothetical protein GX645_01530 [Candidatus Sumerlaeota bacterium]|nr:hypothetical protein [Candidatus Sumerlaeota bacterium]